MTLTRANALGWAPNDQVTAIQLNHMDVEIEKAIDGAGGGPCSPVAQIEIGGAGLKLDNGNKLELDVREIEKTFAEGAYFALEADWIFNVGVWFNDTLDAPIFVPINPPVGSTIKSVNVRYQGAAGHAGLPASMPVVSLLKTTIATGGLSTVATQADTSANTTAFQAAHSITIGGLSEAVTGVATYNVQIDAESGANALVGARCWGVQVSVDLAEYTEWT